MNGFVYKYDGSVYNTDLWLSAERVNGGISISLFNAGSDSKKVEPFKAGRAADTIQGDMVPETISVFLRQKSISVSYFANMKFLMLEQM